MVEEIVKTLIRGHCLWFNDSRGWGYIQGDDGEKYFSHYSDIIGSGHRTLQPFQEVEFVPDKNAKGLRARKIQIL